MTDNKLKMSEQEQQDWLREQLQVATKYLAQKGHITQSVVVEQSRYLVPALAAWKVKLSDGKFVWVVCGDLPTDHSSAEVATTAREALRHFSLKWQMQAENLNRAGSKEQDEFANLLIDRAEQLYALCDRSDLWATQE